MSKIQIIGQHIFKIEKTEKGFKVFYEDEENFKNRMNEEYNKRKTENENKNETYLKYLNNYKDRLENNILDIKKDLNLNEYICNKNCYNKICFRENNEWRKECITKKIIMFMALKRKREREKCL